MRQYTFLICILAGVLYARSAAAESTSERSTGNDQAILVNPVGSVAGVFGAQLLLPTSSVNGRYQRAYSDRLALMIAPQFVRTEFIGLRNYVLAVKIGPRVSLSRRGLAGWYVLPMAILGWGLTTQLERRLRSSGIAGVGVEFGRAWHWRWFVLELGGGVHYTGFVAHYSPLSGASGDPPASGFGPIANISLGYGW